MTKEMNVIISRPLYLINNTKDIKNIIENIKIFNEKNVLILDTISNEVHYKGCLCNMIK